MLVQRLAGAIHAHDLRTVLVLLEGLFGKYFELLLVGEHVREPAAAFGVVCGISSADALLDLFDGLSVDIEGLFLGFPEPFIDLVLAHLDPRRHLDALLLGGTLAVRLLEDGLEVAYLLLAALHALVAGVQLLFLLQ